MKINAQNYPSVLTEEEFKRFLDKVDKTNHCWNWKAGKTDKGYGRFKLRNKKTLAHRVSYTVLVGPISSSLVLDHRCRNRACVNPDHLEPVTNKVNTLRGIGPTSINSSKTHCSNYHPLESPNLVIGDTKRGKRSCLACDRARSKYRNSKNKGTVLDPDLFKQVADLYYKEIAYEIL